MRGKVSLHLRYSANEMEGHERIIGNIRCLVKDHDRDIDVGLQRVNDFPPDVPDDHWPMPPSRQSMTASISLSIL